MKKIGTITIGQSPRVDIIPELRALLEPDCQIIEKGALDGLTKEQIAHLAPRTLYDEVLITPLTDGTSVTISDKAVIPRVQQCIQELEQEEVSAILLLCTGTFPTFTSQVPLLVPEPLLYHFVRGQRTIVYSSWEC
jgi:protein AroM